MIFKYLSQISKNTNKTTTKKFENNSNVMEIKFSVNVVQKSRGSVHTFFYTRPNYSI
ncbi:hypothetical protein DDB_G0270768 [Dictyostelium discoideum AX4]|uniref:Uncharacterized protein n=1 Tax=Dictyostelium discoideum TaxID=44689 RepID=Q55C20_DICDI|nr:hypothetical protein DDB_G0270768 [Dictyostelium discoideum AX4]EAL72734.1 hypothetical protein DDB_G0270768 [Dictyostelium discoideum AX4]|eukprot:XP_646661.1 hypothetical protein DDB_G0270768 [Dictyostelium discoideum AX4]